LELEKDNSCDQLENYDEIVKNNDVQKRLILRRPSYNVMRDLTCEK